MQKLGLDRIGDVVADEVRRVQVEVLREERNVLSAMIARLDARIAGLGGKRRGRPPKAASTIPTPAATRRPRRRRRVLHRPGETLREMVAYALAKVGGPVKATTLVDLVQEVGYKTTAKRSTLLTSIYHVLADEKLFRKFGKGVFGLVAAPSAPRRGAKPMKPAKPSAVKGGEPLGYFVLRAFWKIRGPLKVAHLVKRVQRLGYRTPSTQKNLLLSLYRVLRDTNVFRKVGVGLYELALPSPKRRKVGRPMKRARATTKKASPAAAKEQKAEAPEQTAPAEVKHAEADPVGLLSQGCSSP